MNGSSSSGPPPYFVEVGRGMKSFLLLVFLLGIFFIIGASDAARVDLTPDTPSAVVQQDTQNDFIPQPQVIQIQEGAVSQNQPIPITGTCTDPYTVQSGDYLSRIAQICNTTVGDIRIANPQIANINLIYPGQVLRIPGSAVNPEGSSLTVPVTGLSEKMSPVLAPTATQTAGEAPLPVTGTVQVIPPGTVLQVRAQNFPPNTLVTIGMMPENGPITVLFFETTDASGNLTTDVVLPDVQSGQIHRIVIISSTSDNAQQVLKASAPFIIGDIQ